VLLEPGSWEVSGQVTQLDDRFPFSCEVLDFTLDVAADQLVTVGRNGQMDVAEAVLLQDGFCRPPSALLIDDLRLE
jgi:hypothetical protein